MAQAVTSATIGIDLGGTKIEGVLLDHKLRVLARERLPTEQEHGYEHILGQIATVVGLLREAAATPVATVIGVGAPGSISSRTGLLKNSNTACLNGRKLDLDLEQRLGARVRLENDANCFALAEALAGAGRGAEVVFGVILGTGVGGGIVIDGHLRTGPNRIAGDWGHHSIDPAGPSCYCGQRGCVEALLAGPALEAAYRCSAGSAASVRVPEIARRAGAGDAAAQAVIERWLGGFGRALANLIDILDPDVVVLGGGLSNLSVIYPRGVAEVAAAVFNDELRTPIVRNQLGDSAGVIGAALLARAAPPG